MPTTFAVLGAGAWGTAIALHLAQNPRHRVRLWCARPQSARELTECRENVRLLPGVPRVLSLAKGVENETFERPTEIVAELWGSERLAVLSGPSHAEEVSRGLPTSLVAASADLDLARWVQQCFTSERFRVYTNLDIVGVELAGALKNVLAIAAGISDGLGFGDNAKAALLTRGLVEMARFGVALGAEQQTFFGLAGVGGLITTCVSRHGRNHHVGERLAAGEKLPAILASMA